MSKRNYKIAIMTQSLGFNYGGIIQNYALQKVLIEMGHSVVTIDRGVENPNSPVKIWASKYKSLLLRYVFNKRSPIDVDYRTISRNNLRFVKKNINKSPLLHTTSQLDAYFREKNFDLVVVGSDQVWRPKYSPNVYNFFLDFLADDHNIKKISYAASFGTEAWEFSEEETKTCSDLIQHFHGVSVREDSGINLCAEYLNRKDAVHVLDPTLLLAAEDYSVLVGNERKDMGLFTYVLDDSSEKLSFINQCADHLFLEVHRNQAKLPAENIETSHLQDYEIPPLEGWLQGFRDAEFIITDSFHGTVFSIINGKPFFVLVNKSRGGTRFESLLKQLGLEDRLIYNFETFDFSNLKRDIDYHSVFSKLNELKKDSLLFLTKYL